MKPLTDTGIAAPNSVRGKSFFRPWAIALAGALVLVGAWVLRREAPLPRGNPAPALAVAPAVAPALVPPRPEAEWLAARQSAAMWAPKDINRRRELADAYQAAGQLDNAAQELREIVRLAPKDRESRHALAKMYLASQRPREAGATYRVLTQQEPRNGAFWLGLAGALYQQGRYWEASEAARRAVALNANDHGRFVLALCLAEYGLQVPDLDTGLYFKQLGQARKELERLTKVWPANGDVYYQLGRVCLGMSDGKSALKSLLRARELVPQKANVHLQLARAYMKVSDNAAALKVVDEALQRFPEKTTLHDLRGQLLLASDDPAALPQALEACRRAVQLDPDKPLFHERCGIAYQRLGKLEEAVAAFEQAARLNPDRAFPYQQLAALYRRRRDPQRARQYAKIASAMVANEQQLKQFQWLSRLDPQNAGLHLVLADRYRDLRYHDAARDEYLRVLRLDANNKRARAGLASLAGALEKAGTQSGKNNS